MDVSLRQERAQLNQRDIWLASDCVENKICVSLNLVRVPVAALWPWARIALSCVESAIANRARRADAKPFRRLAARHPACNCGNNAFAKIEGQRLHHARQPPLPARILNQNKTDSGIPSDSIRQETALMPFKRHQRAHGHAERFDLFRAAKIGKINHETGRDHIGADGFK